MTFQSFDLKGSGATCGYAIASNGLVAGNADQPFLYAAGRFTVPKLSLPPGLVVFTGVNRFGAISGTDFNLSVTNPSSTNFIDRHGTLSRPVAGGYPISELLGLTDHGAILGQTQLPATGEFSFPRTIGFLLLPGGGVTLIDDGSQYVEPHGMDARADRVVGRSPTSTSNPSWSFTAGVFTSVAYPGAAFTFPTGVDQAGTISGSYIIVPNTQSTYIPSHGFFLRHGTYSTYDVPGATSTGIQGMNEADQITGCYTDKGGTHGFIRTP
jgi:hypothetical protein